MKALTVWQPWASLIAAGAKPYEFRGWPAPRAIVGQRIAIHAGARPIRPKELKDLLARLEGKDAWTTGLIADKARPLLRRALEAPHLVTRSAILCTAVLGVPVNAMDIVSEFGGPVRNDSDRAEHANFAWPLTEIEAVLPPVEASGMQGFWEWAP